jgi:hypothetical protein
VSPFRGGSEHVDDWVVGSNWRDSDWNASDSQDLRGKKPAPAVKNYLSVDHFQGHTNPTFPDIGKELSFLRLVHPRNSIRLRMQSQLPYVDQLHAYRMRVE